MATAFLGETFFGFIQFNHSCLTKMIKPEVTQIFKFIGKVKYAVFLVLGYYFIFQGNIMQKYFLKKTSFTEDVENLSELPTILTTVIYTGNRSLAYGKDFSISFGNLNSTIMYNLTFGINNKHGCPSLRFEEYSTREFGLGTMAIGFLLIPLNLTSAEGDLAFRLTWTLNQNTDLPVVSIGMALSTENNSIPCISHNLGCDRGYYNDGSVKEMIINPLQIGYYV